MAKEDFKDRQMNTPRSKEAKKYFRSLIFNDPEMSTKTAFEKCREKYGYSPNTLRSYFNVRELRKEVSKLREKKYFDESIINDCLTLEKVLLEIQEMTGSIIERVRGANKTIGAKTFKYIPEGDIKFIVNQNGSIND